jgi:TonB-linked SusC/RagA family outer membrane protein
VGNGRPGTGATFNIRGITSINGGTPLILVDGVQMDPNQIDPNDIDNVSILKDASSSAIYGVRGAFGVVLITTKQGKKNTAMNIDYSFAYTLTSPTRLPKTMNSVDYIKTFLEADATGAISNGSRGSAPYSPTSTDLQKAIEYVNNPTPANSVYVDPAFPNMYRYVANTDWVKELYADYAPEQQHNISLTGGSDNTTYKASLGYFNQEGLAKTGNQNFNRYNGTLKLKSDLKSWLGVNFSMLLNRINDNSLSPTNTGGSAELAGGDLRSIMPVKHPDGNFAGQGIFTNPVAIATYNGRSLSYSNDLWLSGGFELKPFKNFKIVADYTWNSYTFNKTESLKAYSEYGVNGVFLSVYPWTTPSRVTESNNNDTYTATNAYAQYENTFASKHYLKAMAGYNQELKHTKSISARAKNLLNQDFPVLSLNNDDKPVVGAGIQEWAVSGSFFRVNYAFDNRYLLEVNGRYDGTSRFGRGNRYAFQPSISAAWRISQEKFFSPLKSVFNDLKLRASYGTLGNQQLTSNYPYIATMGYGTTGYIFGTQTQNYISAPGLVSEEFSWEKVTTKNIGLDLGLMNNRMTGSFDFYTRDTKDMVVAGTPLPTVLGTSAPSRNAADLRTKGFELSIGWNDKINDDLRYNVSLALSDYQAEIMKYDLNPNNLITTYYVGQKIGEIWGYETQGFYATDADAAKVDNTKIWGGKWLAGDIQYRDLDKDGKTTPGNNTLTNPGDRRIIGNNTPRYQYGINTGLTYKGFDFTMFFQGVAKRDLALSGNFFWGYSSEWNTVTEALVGSYWTPDHTDAYFGRLRLNGQPNQQVQTKFLQSGAYLRMKQITLGYTIPQSIVNKVNINRLRIYVTGQNLFEFTKIYKNFDPEQPSQGSYPINRALSFGVQLSL